MTTAAQDAGNAETVAQPDPITFPRTLTSGKNSAANEQCGYFWFHPIIVAQNSRLENRAE